MPSSLTGYENIFTYNKRAVQCKMIEHDGFNVHIFPDADLVAEELADLTIRTEKINNGSAHKSEMENKRRLNNKGRLSDEELEKLKPLTIADMYSGKEEIGTITIKTNRTELNTALRSITSTSKGRKSNSSSKHILQRWILMRHICPIIIQKKHGYF